MADLAMVQCQPTATESTPHGWADLHAEAVAADDHGWADLHAEAVAADDPPLVGPPLVEVVRKTKVAVVQVRLQAR